MVRPDRRHRGPYALVTIAALVTLLAACADRTPTETVVAPTTSTTATAVPAPATTRVVATPNAPSATTAPPTTTLAVSEAEASVEQTLASLTLEQKIGQLIIAEFTGPSATVAVSELVAEGWVGGFILKSANGNLVDPDQVTATIADLQAAAPISLLIAVDQEGGRVDRVTFPDTVRFPAPERFGQIGDAALVEDAAWATGVQLRALGFNVDFAPVAAVNLLGSANPAIGDRSYGSDVDVVVDLTAAAVRGFDRAGVAAAVKHFPGHGRTSVDSHQALPEVSVDYETWAISDRRPFEAAIAEGVPMVMVGHLVYPALDSSGTPATLSRPIVTGELREKLGFDGVVIADDLSGMDALGQWSRADRSVLALAAGVDLLLNPGDAASAVEAIVKAVEAGELSEHAIDAAVRRVLALRWQLSSSTSADDLDPSTLAEINSIAMRVTDACRDAGRDC